jgi:hypothetical protein
VATDLRHVDGWVEDGIISSDQAEAIRHYERGRSTSRGTAREILGYLGAVLVLSAGFVLVGEMWEDITRSARIVISGVAATILTGAGVSLLRSPQRSTRRMGEASLMLAGAPLGLAAGLAAGAVVENEAAVTVGFATALVFNLGFYVWNRSWAQQLGLFLSAAGTGFALGILTNDDSVLTSGVLVMFVGIGWLIGSGLEKLPPRVLGEMYGIGGMAFGSVMIVVGLEPNTSMGRIALAVWIGVSVALVATGVVCDRVVLIIGGVGGVLVYLPLLTNELLGEGAGAPTALLIAGLVLIATAVILTRRGSRT